MAAGTGGIGTDIYEDDNNYYIRSYLPGIDPDAVNLHVQGNMLTVSGETTQETPEGWRPVMQELGYGRFERQIALDTPVDADKAQATYHDGILEITLPKAEAHRPKTIQVRAA